MESSMEASIQNKEKALETLTKQIYHLSTVFRESYLENGRGALVVHTFLLEKNHQVSSTDYRTKKQSLFLFDSKKSKEDLQKLIDNYDPKTEGILILITQPDNATWFMTFKLKSKSEDSKK